MRITIDTKADSKDEIRKAIKMLMGIVGGHDVYTNEQPQEEKPAAQPNIFDNPGAAVPNLMSMFDNAPTTNATPTAPQEEEITEDIPQVEFY